MSHLNNQTHIYYYVLKGNQNILADERDKKRLLDIVLEVHQGHSICAFCVTDEEAVFLECAGDIRKIREKARRVTESFEAYLDKRSEKDMRADQGLALTELQELPTGIESVLEYVRRIHRLPVKLGYVCRISDYWWSSYPAYTGVYQWEVVDQEFLLSFFDQNEEKARRKLRRFHQAADSGQNSTPQD